MPLGLNRLDSGLRSTIIGLAPDKPILMEEVRMKIPIIAIGALLLPGILVGQDELDPDRAELRKKAHAVRTTAEEMRFKQIPWVTDLFEGFRLAKEENRPVFLYMITGDPLDDC